MADKLLSDDHAPPNPHGALLGTLQSGEPGDPELRVSIDAPPEYQRQPGDPDPAGATLVDMTLDDIARMGAVAHDADPTLVVNLGGQNAIADSGIDLMSRKPIEWPDSEHLDSVPDIALTDDLVPVDAPVGIAEQVIRTCVADALRAWPNDVHLFMAKAERGTWNSETPLSVLYNAIVANLRDKHIAPSVVWQLVRRLTYQALESMFARVFGQQK